MLGIGICNLLVGVMSDANKQPGHDTLDADGWGQIMFFFADMAMMAFACCIMLCVLDNHSGRRLYDGQRDKKKRQRQESRQSRGWSYGQLDGDGHQ